jgi:hypothetical protein
VRHSGERGRDERNRHGRESRSGIHFAEDTQPFQAARPRCDEMRNSGTGWCPTA